MMRKAQEEGKALVNAYDAKLREHDLKGSVHFEIGKPGEVIISELIVNCGDLVFNLTFKHTVVSLCLGPLKMSEQKEKQAVNVL